HNPGRIDHVGLAIEIERVADKCRAAVPAVRLTRRGGIKDLASIKAAAGTRIDERLASQQFAKVSLTPGNRSYKHVLRRPLPGAKALIVDEKESSITAVKDLGNCQRSAQTGAKLVLFKRSFGLCEEVASIQHVVANELVKAAMEVVRPTFRE